LIVTRPRYPGFIAFGSKRENEFRLATLTHKRIETDSDKPLAV